MRTRDFFLALFATVALGALAGAAIAPAVWHRGPALRTVEPQLSNRVSEVSAVEALSTTAVRVDCGRDSAPKSWKCVDSAAGGVTVYRGGSDVTSSNGVPENADTAFGGDSVAHLVLASGTLNVRCTCGF